MVAQKKLVIGVAAFLAVSLLLGGIVAFATNTDGSNDPIVGLGYLEQEFSTGLMAKIEDAVKQQVDKFETKLDGKYNQLSADLEAKAGSIGSGANTASLANDPEFISAVAAAVLAQMPESSGGGTTGSTYPGFTRVDVKSGKTITLDLCSEVVLRIGNATCVASGSPGLINLSTGGVLESGKALEKNNHYISTVVGRGFKATADVTVFIRGGYTES